jgi:signal transduction histidine kinase
MPPAERSVSADLWFRDRPRLAAAIAAALFVVVFVLRQVVHGASEAVCLLYVLPIALVAFAFGRTAGAAAGGFSFVLFGVWALTEDVSFGVVGWLARAVPMLLLGALVGGAADQQRRAAAAERELLASQLRARQAAELNDSIIQRLAAAKWAAEAGNHDRTLDVLTETVESAQSLVAELLDGRSIASDESVA